MPKIDKKEMKKNFEKWLEITDLCLNLRLAYLKKSYNNKDALKILFKELKEQKEKNGLPKRIFKKDKDNF